MSKMPDDLYEMLEQCVLVIYNETDKPTGDYGKAEHSSHRIPIFRRLMISTCTMVSVTGAAFNLALICALLKFRQQTLNNNITNLFVLCLAVSDIFLCSVSMPLQVFYEINEHQMASSGLCRVLFAGFGLPLNISCLSILLIAFDRYRMIVHPMKIQMSTQVAIGLIIFVILFGMINSVPVALYVTNTNLTDYSYCVESWPSSEMRLAYSVLVFMLYFVLPLTASGGFYLCIYCKLARHANHLRYRKEAERRKRRTTSLLVATVVCFVLCWTPWCLYSLLLEIQSHLAPGVRIRKEWNPQKTQLLKSLRQMQINPDTCASLLLHMTSLMGESKKQVEFIPGKHIKLIDLLCKMFAMGSTCVNPVLYGWLNEPIQSAMRRQFSRIADCFKRIPGIRGMVAENGQTPSGRRTLLGSCCWPNRLRSMGSRNQYAEVRSKLVIEPPTVNDQRREERQIHSSAGAIIGGSGGTNNSNSTIYSIMPPSKKTTIIAPITSKLPITNLFSSTGDASAKNNENVINSIEQNNHALYVKGVNESVDQEDLGDQADSSVSREDSNHPSIAAAVAVVVNNPASVTAAIAQKDDNTMCIVDTIRRTNIDTINSVESAAVELVESK
ncbi:putative neuropeptide F receptor [Fasciola gigantica]|uniref:Putative neuropeptide F receptor n=1 Tax=Fasciola gigantica TaxID=46835 RepID=A0A504YX70_FASGI|nr:putative neuropeptide F receptor [Fasciola gigantica]